MKKLAVLLAFAAPNVASAQYILGDGTITCADAVSIWEGGEPLQVGELAGWIFGYWSRETFEHDQAFVDIIKGAGARRIVELTVDECKSAPEGTLLFQMTQAIIENTG